MERETVCQLVRALEWVALVACFIVTWNWLFRGEE